jgi:hypothetical protein
MNQEFCPVDIIPPLFSVLIYHLGDEQIPFGGRSSETYSHPINMIKIIIIHVGCVLFDATQK